MDKQFPLGLIGAVCLKPFFCSIGTEFLEGKSQTVEKPTGAASECEGKIPHLVESSINVVGFIFVSGEPSQKESLSREQQRCFPTFFLMFTLLYFHAVAIGVSLSGN